MYQINVPVVIDGEETEQRETIYKKEEVPFLDIMLKSRTSRKPGQQRGVEYLEIPCAFDIETTNVYKRVTAEDEAGKKIKKSRVGKISKDFRPFAFMYQWQFCIDTYVIFGRTWEEFLELLKYISDNMQLSAKRRLVCGVHNLAFEFQFMRRFLESGDFRIIDGFYKDKYQPIKVAINQGIEFRCTFVLSNMTLGKFCENERGVIHYKLSGDDYDYSKRRTSKTILTMKEQAYCYNDVRGLCECIASRLEHDTFAKMPMTSTGYVRRDARNNMRKHVRNRQQFIRIKLNAPQYTQHKKGFRGGDVHANAKNKAILLESGVNCDKIQNWDIASSYPSRMILSSMFPVGKWNNCTVKWVKKTDPKMKRFCYIFDVALYQPVFKEKHGMPYLSKSKCQYDKDCIVEDNGRILSSSSWVVTTITNVDWWIIQRDYDFRKVMITNMQFAARGRLPKELRDTVMTYYRRKTELKDVTGKEYEYAKSKNSLNACYGMIVTAIDMAFTRYEDGEYKTDTTDLQAQLDKFYKSRNSFLSYQWGIFVTALARYSLHKMLWVIGEDAIYCDTDSIKCLGDHTADFEAMNAQIRAKAEKLGAYADRDGKRYYLGVWENEGDSEKFITLGSKKYLSVKGGYIYSTIAGVSRKRGHDYFTENGLDNFADGTEIENSGHLVAYYNDDQIHTITIDGVTMTTASNVALVDDTYTIGKTMTYRDLMDKLLDNIHEMVYT